jgi:hypothetical protein
MQKTVVNMSFIVKEKPIKDNGLFAIFKVPDLK